MSQIETLRDIYIRLKNGPIQLTKDESLALKRFIALEQTVTETVIPAQQRNSRLNPIHSYLLTEFKRLKSVIPSIADTTV